MKSVIIVVFTLKFLTVASGQNITPCTTIKVISPAVTKPSNDSIVSATCNSLTVSWKGASNQTYIVALSFKNPSTGKIDTTQASAISCNASNQCTATLPVTAGTTVNWNVQALQVIQGRTFYSYVLNGKRDLPIPKCPAAVVKDTKPAINEGSTALIQKKGDLMIYPDPTSHTVVLDWQNEFKGKAKIVIIDATGKTVIVRMIQKHRGSIQNNMNVTSLTPGLYYVTIMQEDGKRISGKFVKK